MAGYVRRFDIEHTVRFAKQTLGWTTPRPRHPAQADRWTWLVLAAYTSYAWPARSPPTSGCRGNGPDRSHGCHRCECAEGFRGFSPGSARRLPHRNPPAAPRAGPRAAAPRPAPRHPAIKKSAKKASKTPHKAAKTT